MTRTKPRWLHPRAEIDMTEGSIVKNLVRFALPLIAGNLLQQLYNMVDTWVIGQTGNKGAYAAVGSVGPIINMLIGFFMGLSSGAGVVISQYYGARDKENVRKAVHTAIALTLILCVVLTALGLLLTPAMLHIMLGSSGAASDDIFGEAKTYLTIYFAGMAGLLLYNMGAGILRAVGDSDRPFYYLVAAAVTNTVLDLVFVFGFHMGVAGVAWATILAQFISAALTVLTLLRTDSCVKVSLRDIRLDLGALGKIFRVGIPAALQMMLTAFSNIFVQSYIAGVSDVSQANALGGWTTYAKIDQLIFLPLQSFALAATTFVGQNLGKGDVRRAKKGTYITYGLATGITGVLIVLIMAQAPFLAALFNPDPEVIHYATMLLRRVTPFYLCSCVNQIFAGALRGAGNSRAPMLIMLSAFVGFRQVYLYILSHFVSNHLLPIAMGYPAGWFACCVAMLLYYRHFSFERSRLVVGAGTPEP